MGSSSALGDDSSMKMNEDALICRPALRSHITILEPLTWARSEKLLVELCTPMVSIFESARPNQLTLILAQHEQPVQ